MLPIDNRLLIGIPNCEAKFTLSIYYATIQ
jgi:hypothetical protein